MILEFSCTRRWHWDSPHSVDQYSDWISEFILQHEKSVSRRCNLLSEFGDNFLNEYY